MPGTIKNPGTTNTTKDSQKELSLDDGRKLTSGEIALCKKLFENAIDYQFVRIHKGKLIPGVQSDQVSMTPWGELYMPKGNYRADFSIIKNSEDIQSLHHFVHEMSHVWQYQRKSHFSRGTVVICGSILSLSTGLSQAIEKISSVLPDAASEVGKDIAGEIDPYTYRNSSPKDFFSYNLESQAEILADYFVQKILAIPNYNGKASNRRLRTTFFTRKL